MYNQVTFFAKNTPVNATIHLEVTLEGRHTREEAISLAETVLTTWGILPSNVEVGDVTFFDCWAVAF